jgi:DNA polymerase-1
MIMQVHDELVFEVREDQCEAARAAIREHMENAAALKAPLRVETGLGLNWDEAH